MWKNPSIIYASPLILYEHQSLSLSQIEQYLKWLRLSKVMHPQGEQEYALKPDAIEIHLGSFTLPEGQVKKTSLRVHIHQHQISLLERFDQNHWQSIESFVLPPVEVNRYYEEQKIKRTYLPLKAFPKKLVQAVLIMEDRQFYKHHGLDYMGIVRALMVNIIEKKIKEGASTISQQLVKNLFLTQERTFIRKIREAWMTLMLECLYTKDEILEAYLNEIYLGQNMEVSIHGFEEASQLYFAKSIHQISLSQMAILVGLISSPGRFSPLNDLATSQKRRNVVLKVLLDQKIINQVEHDRAHLEKMNILITKQSLPNANYFMDGLNQDLHGRYQIDTLKSNGLKVYTTLDLFLQQNIERAITQEMKVIDETLRKKNIMKKPQVALIALDPQLGKILALSGGRNFQESQFNRAINAKRQVGSAIKPFVLATALSNEKKGFHLASLFPNVKKTFVHEGQNWKPDNYSKIYSETVTLRQALEQSLNLPFAHLAFELGLENVYQHLVAFGFQLNFPYPAMVLGALESTPMDLAKAYTVLANEGQQSQLSFVEALLDSKASMLELNTIRSKSLLDPKVARLVNLAMQGVCKRGTARSLATRFKFDISGKTGTSDDYRDNWFVGYVKNFLVLVWVGMDDASSVGLTGSQSALQIFSSAFASQFSFKEPSPYADMEGVTFEYIDEIKGCRYKRHKGLREAFIKERWPQRC